MFKSIKATFPGSVTSLAVSRGGCGKSMAYRMNPPDGCRTGDVLEHCIWIADGYQTEFAMDTEQYVRRNQGSQTGLDQAGVREDVHYAKDPK